MAFPRPSGPYVCRSCGHIVGLNDESCYNCGARNPALWGYSTTLRRLGVDFGFTQLIIGITSGIYLLMLVTGGIRLTGGIFSFLSPSAEAMYRFGATGYYPVVFLDRWWTVLSAAWLHGGALHIFFNLMWIRQLVPAVTEIYGTGRTIILYTAAAIFGGLLTSFASFVPLLSWILGHGGFSVGASGAVFGLLGALIHYGRRGGVRHLSSQVWGWAIALFVFGLVMPGVDNWGHLGGFLGGWLAARWLDPLKPETINHYAVAVLCLLATIASIVASVVVPIPPEFLALLRQ